MRRLRYCNEQLRNAARALRLERAVLNPGGELSPGITADGQRDPARSLVSRTVIAGPAAGRATPSSRGNHWRAAEQIG